MEDCHSLGPQNSFLNNITCIDMGVPPKADVVLMDPAARIARAFLIEQNADGAEYLQLGETKHLESVVAIADLNAKCNIRRPCVNFR
jgi:hypothetical protein